MRVRNGEYFFTDSFPFIQFCFSLNALLESKVRNIH